MQGSSYARHGLASSNRCFDPAAGTPELARKDSEFLYLKPNALRSLVLPLPQTVIAERTSYSSVVMPDGKERKVGNPNSGGGGRDRGPDQLLLYQHVFERA